MTLAIKTTEEFAGQVVGDVSATFSGVMTNIGHKLGLYKAMAFAGRLTSTQLSEKTALTERYVREWLSNQVAGGYLLYDPNDSTYELPDEYVPVLADEESPVFLVPGLQVASSLWHDEDKIAEVFKTGEGIAWAEHHHHLFCGSESLFRPGYKAFLVSDWLKAMDGVIEKLQRGAKVADVGCGHGASTIVMGKAFQNSSFYGFDSHMESITTARVNAISENVNDNISFEVQEAQSYRENEFDLICFMDCLHDMGDPVGAAKHAAKSLKQGGSLLLVEPASSDRLEDNVNPVSRLFYAASTAVCTPCSKSQEVALALGAQAGQMRLTEVLEDAGFNHISRVAETPFNMVLEARIV
jgi:2-polyprenyl-3-methyl-5-hydroxy-6-metoxy-1,4-benzoquinol methylase